MINMCLNVGVGLGGLGVGGQDRCEKGRDHNRPNLVSQKPPNESVTTQTAGEGGEKKQREMREEKEKKSKIVIKI